MPPPWPSCSPVPSRRSSGPPRPRRPAGAVSGLRPHRSVALDRRPRGGARRLRLPRRPMGARRSVVRVRRRSQRRQRACPDPAAGHRRAAARRRFARLAAGRVPGVRAGHPCHATDPPQRSGLAAARRAGRQPVGPRTRPGRGALPRPVGHRPGARAAPRQRRRSPGQRAGSPPRRGHRRALGRDSAAVHGRGRRGVVPRGTLRRDRKPPRMPHRWRTSRSTGCSTARSKPVRCCGMHCGTGRPRPAPRTPWPAAPIRCRCVRSRPTRPCTRAWRPICARIRRTGGGCRPDSGGPTSTGRLGASAWWASAAPIPDAGGGTRAATRVLTRDAAVRGRRAKPASTGRR